MRTLGQVLNDPKLMEENDDDSSKKRPLSKKIRHMFTFSTPENYFELVAVSAPLVAPGGYFVTFTNTQEISRKEYVSL